MISVFRSNFFNIDKGVPKAHDFYVHVVSQMETCTMPHKTRIARLAANYMCGQKLEGLEIA